MKTNELYSKIGNVKVRGAWNNGVKWYALYLLKKANEYCAYMPDWEDCEKHLLNGAKDWKQYSNGGCALVYNEEIAKVLCSPSELKRCKNGMNKPNRYETWLDVQARALYQACDLIKSML